MTANPKNIVIVYGFSGEYTTEINDNGDCNIPHEAINLFKADDGKFYWYVAPYGSLKNKCALGPDFTEKGTVLLFVHNLCNGKGLEIIARAEIDEIVAVDKYQRSEKPIKAHLFTRSDSSARLPTYGHRRLAEIFAGNRGDGDETVYVTCRVNSPSPASPRRSPGPWTWGAWK